MTNTETLLPTTPAATETAEGSGGNTGPCEKLALAVAFAALKDFGLDPEDNNLEIQIAKWSATAVKCHFSAEHIDRDFALGDNAQNGFRLYDIGYGVNEGGFGLDGAVMYEFQEMSAIVDWSGSCPEYCDDNCDGNLSGTVWLIPKADAAAMLADLREALLRNHAARIVSYLCSGGEVFDPAELGAAVRRAMLDVAVDPARAAHRAELVKALADGGLMPADARPEVPA